MEGETFVCLWKVKQVCVCRERLGLWRETRVWVFVFVGNGLLHLPSTVNGQYWCHIVNLYKELTFYRICFLSPSYSPLNIV